MLKQTCTNLVVTIALLSVVLPSSASPQAGVPSSNSGQSTPSDRLVLTVGDRKLTAREVENIIEALPPQSRAFYGGDGKKFLPVYLVQMAVLSDEARKHSLQADPQVQQALENATEAILANAELQSIQKSIHISEQDLQKQYEQKKGAYEEVRIRRILIRTNNSPIPTANAPSTPALSEAEARKKLDDIQQQILGGADFAELAKKYSEDLATAHAGGDMGYVNRLTVVPPVADAAYALNKGQVSNVIQTPYGLELIKVEDRRVKPFSEVREGLEAELLKTKTDEEIQRLIDQYKVVIDKQYFSARPHPDAAASSVTR